MSEKQSAPLFRQKLEFLLLTQRNDVLTRAKDVISQYYLTFKHFQNLESYHGSLREIHLAQIVLVAQEEGEAVSSFSNRVEYLLEKFPRSSLVTVLREPSLKEEMAVTQRDRVIPLSAAEFFTTLKFSYICLLKTRSQYFEISPSDLFPMSTLPFTVSVRLQLNQRFLGVAFRGMTLSESKYQRLLAVPNIYFQAKDGPAYYSYINTYFDDSGAALKKKARAAFLSVCCLFLEMNDYLLFDLKSSSEERIQNCYERLVHQIEALLPLLQNDESLWDIFRESAKNDLFAAVRSPWVGVYAAMICLKSGQGDPLVAFLSALFADVGLFDIQEEIAVKYLREGARELNDAEMREVAKNPILSLNRCLIKKFPLSESIKAVVVTIHERADEKGYPNQVPADKIPLESHVIRFAGLIDLGVRTTMAETGVGFRFLKEKIWEKEQTQPGNFSLEFLNAIADSLI
ncbi:HD domain-containing phosphohydrolase [Bdellovibrio svalbardensis]|uniref:HD-GYP domain-containing protein n=1 Tax=Bdellovibrio svalbardensis TaxID=2972972 RepID=A0ABT6DNR0_9BACT|nr:HD domain-containing phosphohydrolase [Bdellovibrio svalbardensis]MDG0818286.1 hypothetical protein [Bdellovibrio svalbardensis]